MYRYLLLLLLIIVPLEAAELAEAFYSPDLGSSARMIRRGNVEGFSSVADIVFENPAGLYRIRKFSTSAFSTRFMDEVEYKSLSVAFRLPVGMVGIGMLGTSVSDIPKTFKDEESGEFDVSGYFNYKNYVSKLSYQYSTSRYFHIGASISYYMTDFDTVSGRGYNSDVGFLIDSDALDFSFVVKNIMRSSQINYTDSSGETATDIDGNEVATSELSSEGMKEELPLQTYYSLKYSLVHFQVYGQLKTVGRDRKFVKSVGLNFNPTYLPFFHASIGAKQSDVMQSIESEVGSNIQESMSMGVGLDLLGVNFDYAFEKSEHIEFDNKHYFSMALSF